jgi:elongation factor P--beta-lysine ligase
MTDLNKYIELKKAVGEWIDSIKTANAMTCDKCPEDMRRYYKAERKIGQAESKIMNIYHEMKDSQLELVPTPFIDFTETKSNRKWVTKEQMED